MDARPDQLDPTPVQPVAAAQNAVLRLFAVEAGAGKLAQAFARAAGLGFSHALIPPPWPGFIRRGAHLALQLDRIDPALAAGSGVGHIAAGAAAAKIGLVMDVQVDRVAARSALADAPDSPFRRPAAALRLDPRLGTDFETASATLSGAGDALALAAWWGKHLAVWQQRGVAGFRLLGLKSFPDGLAGVFFAALRQALPKTLFLVWTPGLTREALASLAGTGVDGVFSSLPWWDWRAPWFWEEMAALAAVGPVLGLDAAPGDAAPSARNVALAATIGQGWLHADGGADDDAVRALNGVLVKTQVFAAQNLPRLPAGDGAAVLPFLRLDGADHREATQAALVVVNGDAARSLSVTGASLLPAMGGVFGAFQAVGPVGGEALAPGTVLTLAPGEVRIFAATRLAPEAAVPNPDAASAGKAASAPRLAIELPTPCVDGGAFPVKAIAGEMVSVEADVVFDGHDKIAVALGWRGPNDAAWQEVPMRPLGNDRWQAAFPLTALGRHAYVVAAWRDRFETFRDELAKKSAAKVPVALELIEGERLVEAAAKRQQGKLGGQLRAALAGLGKAAPAAKLDLLLAPALALLMAEADDRPFLVETRPVPVDAERIEARFAAWYEVFPRSMSDDPRRHGTFADVEKHLPRIRDMGFDVLYFPPISPIGRVNRKGRNNTLTPAADDPGSPYAIGAAEGGHDALHPELGSFADFAHLRQAAAAHGLELAIDFAIQCSPDHPWLKQHPGWFDWRPDGSIRYAENPPKKYEDIVNVDFYAADAVPDLWVALCDVVLFWAGQGVRLFRVDNPHTKPLPFWEWMIAQVRARYPDAIFLAEAFTRPKVMYRLAKVGFSQSYTYFTWRNAKRELEAYLTELDQDPPRDFFRPHFFVNTPDINPLFLQTSGRPGFLIRAALAATLSGLWGVYNGFELCEAAAIPGKEEYLDSEKYQIRAWDWDRPGNIVAEITALNRIRRQNPALQTHRGVHFLPAWNEAILYFEKATADRSNVVLVAISLDPHQAQEADFELPLWRWSLPDAASLEADDLVSGERFTWHGKYQHMRLTQERPYAIWRVRPTI